MYNSKRVASRFGLKTFVSRDGDSPIVATIQNRISVVVICIAVLPMNPRRTALTSPDRFASFCSSIRTLERESATVATMAPMRGMNSSTLVKGPNATFDMVSG